MSLRTVPVFDAAHWHQRAEEALEVAEEAMTVAEGMRDPEARRLMLGIARDYEAQAMHARSMETLARSRNGG